MLTLELDRELGDLVVELLGRRLFDSEVSFKAFIPKFFERYLVDLK